MNARHTRKDKIRNEDICGKVGVAVEVDKMQMSVKIGLKRDGGKPRKNWTR